MKPQLPAFCLGLIILYNITDTRAADIDGINDGIFTSQQAKSGKHLYKQYCKSCHDGTYFGPVLLAWQGEALTDLFELMTAMMPENDPGGLTGDQYTDLLAYILKTGGYPEGNKPLIVTTSAFATIVIEPPMSN